MIGRPFFSVIIPTYNRAKFIQQTIKSMLDQDFEDFELIVVDDGSTDNTEDIVSAIHDKRLTYLKKENAERAAARNYGARHAKGKYVNFFDSDDLAYPHHLSMANSFIQRNSNPEIFHLGYDIKDVDGRLLSKVETANDINRNIIRGNFLSCNGVFIRQDIIITNPFNEDRALSSLEDWELWIRMASRYNFRQVSGVTSTVIHHDERSVFGVDTFKIKKKAARFIEHTMSDKRNVEVYGKNLKIALGSINTYVALHLAMAKADRSDIWQYLKRGIMQNPGEMFRKRFLVIIKLALGF
jgi:glycosyltransferase involved in cell wall biosynthesis